MKCWTAITRSKSMNHRVSAARCVFRSAPAIASGRPWNWLQHEQHIRTVTPDATLDQPAVAVAEPTNVLIVGVGGQGVIMVSKILARLSQLQGLQVKQSEVHGMAKRGGSVFSHIRFGEEVWSPTIPMGEADVVLGLEWAEGLRWLRYLKPGIGTFISDTRKSFRPFPAATGATTPGMVTRTTTLQKLSPRCPAPTRRTRPHGQRNWVMNGLPTRSCSRAVHRHGLPGRDLAGSARGVSCRPDAGHQPGGVRSGSCVDNTAT